MCLYFLFLSFSRSPISVAAAAIYMASQASDEKRSQKGSNDSVFSSWLWNAVLWLVYCCLDHSVNQKLYLCIKIVRVFTGNNCIYNLSPSTYKLNALCEFNNMQNSKLNRQMGLRYRESNVRRLLPASDYCRAQFCCLNFARAWQ